MKEVTLGSLKPGSIFLFGNVAFALESDPKKNKDESLQCSFLGASQVVYIERVAIVRYLK